MKKFLSLLICFVMVFSVVPVNLLATDDVSIGLGDSAYVFTASSDADLLKGKYEEISTDGSVAGNVPETGVNSKMNAAVLAILCFDSLVFFALMVIRKKVEL